MSDPLSNALKEKSQELLKRPIPKKIKYDDPFARALV